MRKNILHKQILAFLMALVMTAGSVPVNTLAEETGTDQYQEAEEAAFATMEAAPETMPSAEEPAPEEQEPAPEEQADAGDKESADPAGEEAVEAAVENSGEGAGGELPAVSGEISTGEEDQAFGEDAADETQSDGEEASEESQTSDDGTADDEQAGEGTEEASEAVPDEDVSQAPEEESGTVPSEDEAQQDADAEISEETEAPADASSEDSEAVDVGESEEETASEEAVMPAESFSGWTKELTVEAYVEEGVFPEGTSMHVEPVTKKELEQVIAEEEAVDAIAVDITFADSDGNEIQPAEGRTVEVTLTANRVVEGDFHEAVTMDEKGNTETVGDATAVETTFDAEHFTIYAIVGKDEEPALLTVNFYDNDGKLLSTQIVKNGDTLLEPEVPAGIDQKVFIGWYEEGAANAFTGFGTVSGITETATLNLTARYSEAIVHVIYHDQLDNVVDNLEVPANGTVEVLSDSPIVRTTKDTECHVGWATEKGGKENVAGTLTVGTEDVNLYPIVKEGYWVTFDTDGGTAYNRQFIAWDAEGDEKKAKEPGTPPYKEGYIFDKWYSDSEHTTAYDFDAYVTENTTIYAGYNPDPNTLYTVVYWVEYQTDYETDTWDYRWIARQTKNGKTGEDAVYDEDYIFSDPYYRSSKGYELNEVKTEKNVKIAADGTTVLNVYYDCKMFHFSFTWKNASGQNEKFIDQDMKYTASTRKIWDKIDEARGDTTWRFVFKKPAGWVWIRSFSDWPTCPDEDQDWTITDNPNDNLFYRIWLQTLEIGLAPDGYTAETNHSARIQLGYQTDSRTYYLYNQGSFNAGANGAITPGTDGVPEGFAFRIVLSDGNGNDNTVWFHAHRPSGSQWTYWILDNERASEAHPGPQYEFNSSASLNDLIGYVETDGYLDCYCIRLTYDLNFHVNGGEEVPNRRVYYERNLKALEPENYVIGETKKTNPDGQVMLFEGWYTNVELTERFDTFDMTMPAYNIDLYAKWVPVTYSVTYQYENGDPDYVAKGLEYGDHAPQVDDPSYTDHLFLGWTLNGRPYNFDSGVSKDITLVAKWRSVEAYPVTYDLNGGSGTAPADPDTYYEGSDVVVLSADGITPPAGKVFLGWKSGADGKIYYANGLATMPLGGLTLTAQWGDVDAAVDLIYDFNFDSIGYTGAEVKSVTVNALPNNGNVAAAEYKTLGGAIPDGYVFKTWNTKADGSGKDAAPGDEIYVDNQGENRLYAIWEKAAQPQEPGPHLTVNKRTVSTPKSSEGYEAFEEITYEISVTNDGSVTVTDIVVSDALTGNTGDNAFRIESLEPGETSTVFTVTYTVTASDANAGSVHNEATGTGKAENPDDPENPTEIEAVPGTADDDTILGDSSGNIPVTPEPDDDNDEDEDDWIDGNHPGDREEPAEEKHDPARPEKDPSGQYNGNPGIVPETIMVRSEGIVNAVPPTAVNAGAPVTAAPVTETGTAVKTGDDTPVMMWVLILLAAMAAAGGALTVSRRRRRAQS